MIGASVPTAVFSNGFAKPLIRTNLMEVERIDVSRAGNPRTWLGDEPASAGRNPESNSNFSLLGMNGQASLNSQWEVA